MLFVWFCYYLNLFYFRETLEKSVDLQNAWMNKWFDSFSPVQIGERMEELRSMLGWILVHWRAQKNQLLTSKKAGEAQADAIYSEVGVLKDFLSIL